jgi:hypothetical protein
MTYIESIITFSKRHHGGGNILDLFFDILKSIPLRESLIDPFGELV